MRIPEDLSIETQKKICDSHVGWFQKLIARGKEGDRTVRVVECEAYLKTWTTGRTALEIGAPLPADVVQEMEEAIWSGEADEQMTPEELVKFNAAQEAIDDSELEEQPCPEA